MATLRDAMLRDLQFCGFSARTQEAYLRAVRQLAAFYRSIQTTMLYLHLTKKGQEDAYRLIDQVMQTSGTGADAVASDPIHRVNSSGPNADRMNNRRE